MRALCSGLIFKLFCTFGYVRNSRKYHFTFKSATLLTFFFVCLNTPSLAATTPLLAPPVLMQHVVHTIDDPLKGTPMVGCMGKFSGAFVLGGQAMCAEI